MARRPAPVGIDRRQQILESALDLFAERGMDGATNEEIADRASVTPGLIYFYFRSKDDLLLAAFEHQAALAFAALDLTHEAETDEPLAEAVRRMVTRFVDLMEEPRMASLLCVVTRALVSGGHSANKSERVRRAVREQSRPLLVALEQFLRTRIARGEIQPLNLTVASHLIVGGVAAVVMRWQRKQGALLPAREEIVDTVLRILLHGLQRAPGAQQPEAPTTPDSRLAPVS